MFRSSVPTSEEIANQVFRRTMPLLMTMFCQDMRYPPSRMISLCQEVRMGDKIVSKLVSEGGFFYVRSQKFEWVDEPLSLFNATLDSTLELRQHFFGTTKSTFSYFCTCDLMTPVHDEDNNVSQKPEKFTRKHLCNVLITMSAVQTTARSTKAELPDWFRSIPTDTDAAFQAIVRKSVIANINGKDVFPAERTYAPSTTQDGFVLQLRPSDCDMNKHVNHASYALFYEDYRYKLYESIEHEDGTKGFNGNRDVKEMLYRYKALEIDYLKEVKQTDTMEIRHDFVNFNGRFVLRMFLVHAETNFVHNRCWVIECDESRALFGFPAEKL